MKKRNDPYESERRIALGLEHERETLRFAKSFIGKSPHELHVFGLTGDSGAQRWLDFNCRFVTRLEAPDSLLRAHCKQRGLAFTPPMQIAGVKMVRGSYYNESGLDHIRRERFNLFDADSEAGPQIQLRMLEPAISSAMKRQYGLVVRNNMYGWARGRNGSASWWGSDNTSERQAFVRQYRSVLPSHMSITDAELDEPARLNNATFLIKIVQFADQNGGVAHFHWQDFYKPESKGREKATVMCPSIFGIKPR